MERKLIKLLTFFVVLIGFVLNGCEGKKPAADNPTEPVANNPNDQSVNNSANDSAKRLISTVPSITEILFDIGVGHRLVGDSQFTQFPPETAKIEKIGGLYDMNFEKIASLKPDLVIGLIENETLRKQLDLFNIELLTVDHRSLSGIAESYEMIGQRLGMEILETARQRQTAFKERLATFENELKADESDGSKGKNRLRVLICIDRSRGTGRIQNLFVSGTNPLYQEVIRLAGGVNAASETGLPFPNLSTEGIIHLSPDVIIEFSTGGETTDKEKQNQFIQTALDEWKTLGNNIPAVKNNRIYIITEHYATIPGPRTVLLIEKLKDILNRCQSQSF
jgi:iron complex transport system substrate-binding protein